MAKIIFTFITLYTLSANLLDLAAALPSNANSLRPGGVKIVGGTVVTLGTVPYQASLLAGGVNGSHICGGSILSQHYVLTAAHCISPRASGFAVRVGFNTLNKPEAGHQTVEVSEIISHADYDRPKFRNDIALLKLAKPLILNEATRARAVRLPIQGYNASGIVMVTGWGTTGEGGRPSNDLRTVSVETITDSECRMSYPTLIVGSMLCAHVQGGGKDACQGDDGGPLVEKSSGLLIGIVSWGVGCARPEFPGVYTEVSYFVDWILENAK